MTSPVRAGGEGHEGLWEGSGIDGKFEAISEMFRNKYWWACVRSIGPSQKNKIK